MSKKKLERHPLSAAWPDMTAEEYGELKADIQAHGLLHAITLFDGKVLDGWHRYKACQETGITVRTEKFKGDEAAAKVYAKSANGPRRNTTAGQRALAYAEISRWSGRGRPNKSAPGADLSTVSEAAKEAGVSDRTMHQAKAVSEKGSGKLKEAIRSGEVSLKKAAAVVDLPKSEQLTAAKEPPKPRDDEPEPPSEEEMAASEAEIDRVYQEALSKVLDIGAEKVIKEQSAEIARLGQRCKSWMGENKAAVRLVKDRDKQIGALERKVKRLEAENEALRERIAVMEER